MRADAKVFISYRREDAAGHAGRLYDRLKARFPGRVFMDVAEIAPGSDFVETIERGVGECKTLVAIIGNSWLNEDRLRDPNDFVRLEIATALRRGIRVIPVLVRGAHMPTAADLPEDLASLLRRHAISISDEDWESGCERLTQALSQDLGAAEKVSGAVTLWDTAVLQAAKQQLTTFMGPIAGIIVDRAARNARTPEELFQMVAAEIPSQRDREAFLAKFPR